MGNEYILLFSIAIATLQTFSSPDIASSHIEILTFGTSFLPKNNIELLDSFIIETFVYCATKCNINPQCRTFVYDSSSSLCTLYEGEISTGRVLTNSSSTSRVGSIEYFPDLFECYNKTSSTCSFDRYVVDDSRTGLGVCPKNTYWNGNMCLNQLYFGEPCTLEQSCRTDLYLGCSSATAWTCGGAFGLNLVKNGDAETGACAIDDNVTHPMFWSYYGSITQTSYSHADASLTLTSPGPSDEGNCYFSGFSDSYTYMYQTINLSLYSSQIDASRVTYKLSAWLGGWGNQDDHVTTWIHFISSSNITLANATIAPVLANDRMNITQLIYREITGNVPTNTQSVTIYLSITSDTFWNDGSVDDIAFQLLYT